MNWQPRSNGDLVGITLGRTYIIRHTPEGITLLAQKWVEHGFASVEEAKAAAEGMA